MDKSKLLRVDRLKITFLVDNTIEWFTKLPPGFSSELSQHMSCHNPQIDSTTGVPIIDFDKFCCGAHGFSALIETSITNSHSNSDSDSKSNLETHTILFDSGPDSQSLIRNIKSMQTPVESIERLILSHWHSDHSGGILSFLKYRNPVLDLKIPSDTAAPTINTSPSQLIVDLHPDRPIARGIAPPPGDKVLCRLAEDPKFEEIEALGARVEKFREPHVVAGGTVYVSGEIPRVTRFEEGLFGGRRWVEDLGESEGVDEDGGESKKGKPGWIAEPHIMDERYAAIDVLGKGLVIFSSCSHAGIVNVVTDAVKTFQRPVHMVIGGLHLGGPELAYRIEPTVKFLSEQLRPSPTYVLPMHCTGFAAKLQLAAALGEGCVPTGVGNSVLVEGDAEAEKRVFAPVITS